MDKEAFAMASRNTPVRDELVQGLDDIFPILKSVDGIPVVKHKKGGSSDLRRLRLDTDGSTLEVFSTTASFLNRRMSNKTYNLRMLEEVSFSPLDLGVDSIPHNSRRDATDKKRCISLQDTRGRANSWSPPPRIFKSKRWVLELFLSLYSLSLPLLSLPLSLSPPSLSLSLSPRLFLSVVCSCISLRPLVGAACVSFVVFLRG